MSFIKNPSLITAYSALATVALGLLAYDLVKPSKQGSDLSLAYVEEEVQIGQGDLEASSLFSVEGDEGTRLAQRASAAKGTRAQ